MKYLGNAGFFVVAYVILMLPTYFLPFVGSNSIVTNAVVQAAQNKMNPFFWVHLAVLLLLIALTWFRSSLIGKQWLTVFPFLAMVFDLVPGLTFIFLIPTVMHLCAIVMGARGAPAPMFVSAPPIQQSEQVVGTTIEESTAVSEMASVASGPAVEVAPACKNCGNPSDVEDNYCTECGSPVFRAT